MIDKPKEAAAAVTEATVAKAGAAVAADLATTGSTIAAAGTGTDFKCSNSSDLATNSDISSCVIVIKPNDGAICLIESTVITGSATTGLDSTSCSFTAADLSCSNSAMSIIVFVGSAGAVSAGLANSDSVTLEEI
ncbi:hypothetical protein WICPIJ_003525 [Wickerhamomyces pijperi]|uniref:Uncharacterized protein n=1 Tax=Wickerhamomyces pijperi TaxID=599730 RepID=A0A9P8Q789_WICPI|nr:hypothetical protein WICPIJ_003525 [Wickerhamomyces pijperi]